MLELGARKAIALSESMHPLRYLDSGIRATEKLVIREEILNADSRGIKAAADKLHSMPCQPYCIGTRYIGARPLR